MKSFSLSPIAKAIAGVFWLWRHQPDSLHLAENQPKRAVGYDASANKAITETSAALRNDRHDPDAAPMSAEAVVQFAPVKRKRVRVRSPKLYACDIEIDAAYVPKRGNDKTPNIVVSAVTVDDDEMVNGVWWHRANEPAADATFVQVDEFLSLIARRAS